MGKVVNNDYRFERKIVIDSHFYEDLIFLIKSRGFNVLYPERKVCNLYLDDLNYHSYFDNILGNTNRKKNRIRWYGKLFGKVSNFTLEQKIKKGNVGLKNSFKIKKDFNFSKELNYIKLKNLVYEILKDLNSKILVKIMFPSSINTYTRSYYSDIDKKFRITIDKEIKYYSFQHKIKLERIDKNLIIEIKYSNEDDSFAKDLLSFINFRIAKNSKYVQGVETLKY